MILRPLWRPFGLHAQKNIRLMTTSKELRSSNFILTEERGDKGVLILNRPKALNALNVEMIKTLTETITKWRDTKSLILVKSCMDKVFCAGGDVAQVAENPAKYGRPNFQVGYAANYMVACLPIPYISLISGVTIGGGVGLTIHSKYRVATEKTLFAMPEASIGLFPDSAGTYFFPRLQGKLGYYLGLTGSRLKGEDVLHAGIATHFCDSSKLSDLENALLDLNNLNDMEGVMNHFCPKPNTEFTLSKHLDQINKYFAASSIEEILNSLKQDDSEWAKQTIKAMLKSSPTSLKITLRALNYGANLSLGECFQMEYRLAMRLIESADFREGIRAVLVTKDNNPKWNPARIEDVSDEHVLSLFQPLPNNDELPIDVKLNLEL